MATTPARVRLVLLAAFLAAVCRPAPARADVPPAPARVVEGVAATQSGKPLAHMTLYLFGLPPGETDMIQLGDQSTVVTDDRGRFVWAVPPALPPLSDYIGVRSIACYALAADRRATSFRLALRPGQRGTDAEEGTRDLLAGASRPCVTKWLGGGAHPVFSVVVPDTSGITLTVRGPDGGPLRGRGIQVVPAASPTVYGGAVVYTGRTDDGGRLRLRCFPGSLRLQVFAPGVGFGSTGVFDALPGQDAAPALPPLAPFARLSGTVAAALVAPGAAIHLEDFSREYEWYDPRGAVDTGGRWALDGVLPGPHRLVLAGGRGESEPVEVTVAPGERPAGLTIGPKKPTTEVAASLLDSAGRPVNSPPMNKPAARGRVTDSAGRPVAGADVYADCLYFGGRRGGQKVFVVKTDGAGNYLIPDLPVGVGASGVSVHLVAHCSGFPLATGDGQSEIGRASGAWRDMRVDLVLPAQHSGLAVRVLQDGLPLPNVPVDLTADGENPRFSFFLDMGADRGEAAQSLRKLLTPSAQTGPDGAAHFSDLTPGLWTVAANRPTGVFLITPRPTTPFNVSAGVLVRAGQNLSYTVGVHPPSGAVALRVLAPDGHPPAGSPVLLTATTAREPNYGNLSPTVDGAGNQRADLFAPGLFRIRARFRDAPLSIPPGTDALTGPFYEGAALVAVSPATASRGPTVIPTRRLGPASLRVQLEDERGRPLRGTVSVSAAYGGGSYAASADAGGSVIFPDMPLGNYTLTARFAGRPDRTPLSHGSDPPPSDAALLAGAAQPLPQTVDIQGGEERAVTFRPQPVGYLRLRLDVPPERAKDYWFDGRLPSERDFLDTRLDPLTGESLVGPLLVGRRTFRLFRSVFEPVSENVPAGETTVTVEAGRVIRAVLVSHEPPGPPLLLESLVPSGTVLLADGTTPAWGARAGIFTADRPFPLRMVRADAQGRLIVADQWRGARWPWKPTPGSPAGPVVVAWLPGTSGATIIPYVPGQEARLVLPAPISLHGRVTVDGQPVTGLPSSFHIRAAYQGRGTLNEALSVDATAQADGTFELAGLTPGTYRVQAARDDIWLSGTQTLTVGAGALPDLTLDIAPPGLPVVLHLEDGQGRPLAGREVGVERPAGPLTALIWPAPLASDGAGDLRLDGLEAGPHRLTEPNAAFDVPAWTPNAPPLTRRVVLGHTP